MTAYRASTRRTWRLGLLLFPVSADKIAIFRIYPLFRMRPEKNNDIQCLRAVAILLVLIQHYRNRLPTLPGYGRLFDHFAFWPGVDIFFAISGLLICHSFLRDKRLATSRREALATFWTRRWGRLFPTVLFWSIASVCISFFIVSSPDVEPTKIAVGAATAVAGVSNAYWVYCAQHLGANCGNADFNSVTWSLSLEWQLYAVLTALICMVGRRWAVAAMLIFAAIMSTFSAASFSTMWAFRMQAFSLGALTFLLLQKNGALPVISMPRALAIALLLAGIFVCISAPIHVPQPFVLPTIAVGAIMCLLSSLTGTAFSQWSLGAPIIWLGQRSYSVYLCHLPMIIVTKEIVAHTIGPALNAQNVIIAATIAGCLVFVSAELSYRFIELPFQRIVGKKIVNSRFKRQRDTGTPPT
ncbi:acyltransferase [Paraburkholderia sp. BL9I2N2]|uniref:acyltransferase family protein n=1 Tax=Paraburkholderia sp. BL9I2N2 TaxID=1938809 RepID=UPI0010D11E65|nr:acyltransferase [Paraburkholderia sp. BL9I2N2]TCK96549.1 peptidoglycan/LPS O-acetylase OafA/YrhL [Paraburkholderia sp. BL9I2N2]